MPFFKEKAIIIDLDGTLVDNGHRAIEHLDRRKKNLRNSQIRWDEFFAKTIELDKPNRWCMEIVNSFSEAEYHIIFMTGRMDSEISGSATREWLKKYLFLYPDEELFSLYMRPNDDFRYNHLVKLDLLNNHILPKYDILFAIDDMENNIKMFRELGITALHCSALTDK